MAGVTISAKALLSKTPDTTFDGSPNCPGRWDVIAGKTKGGR